MLHQITIRNFRQIKDVTVDLSQSAVVIVGPNNGGKTTLLQAISLFAVSVREWALHRQNKQSTATQRTGVALNFEHLFNIPITHFKEIWRDMKVRRGIKNPAGKPTAENIRIEIHAEGFTLGEKWEVGFEYDYGQNSLIYVRLTKNKKGDFYDFPDVLREESIGYLPSATGLKPIEDKLEKGSILRHIGDGNASDVLRNVCYLLHEQQKDSKDQKNKWEDFSKIIDDLFKIHLNPPRYISLSGILKMTYDEGDKKDLDLSALGSGARQAILLFAYIFAFSNTVHLLDEPDAHLEFIRQSTIYNKLRDLAAVNHSQIIVATHSESVLNEAFPKDRVLSGVFGKFRVENPEDSKIKHALRKYGYDEYIIANQKKKIFYYEGTTDLEILKAFAQKLEMEAVFQLLEHDIFPKGIGGNDPAYPKNHFVALKEFIPDLKGFALFDNLKRNDSRNVPPGLKIKQWERNEIENYIPIPSTLKNYIHQIFNSTSDEETLLQSLKSTPNPLIEFEKTLQSRTPPDALTDLNDSFWKTTKISDDYLTPVFEKFFDTISYPKSTMDKSKFYRLVEFSPREGIQEEIKITLNNLYSHLTS